MKRLATLFLALALLSGGSGGWAQAPPNPAPTPPPAPAPAPIPPVWIIDGATTVKEFELAKLTLTGGPPLSTVMWLVMPDASEYQDGSTLVFTAAPGTYTVIAFAVGTDNKPILLKAVVTMQGAPVPPNPIPPNPGPEPTPNPTPTPTGDVWALAIYDTSQQVSLPSGQLAIYGSPTVKDAVKTAGAYWRRYDVGDSIPTKTKDGATTVGPLTNTKWGQAATRVGLPALILIDSNGTILSATPLPATEDGVVAAVKNAVHK